MDTKAQTEALERHVAALIARVRAIAERIEAHEFAYAEVDARDLADSLRAANRWANEIADET